MKKFIRALGLFLGYILGSFFILRAIAEPFTIDYGNKASYSQDWGGPSLAGVLAVHMVPGIASVIFIYLHQKHRFQKKIRG